MVHGTWYMVPWVVLRFYGLRSNVPLESHFMKEIDLTDAKAAPKLLQAAQIEVDTLKKRIVQSLSFGDGEDNLTPNILTLNYVRDYNAAIMRLTSLEAQIEKHSSAIRGVVIGDAVDLGKAKREVLDRITRFRERRGD
jgi:hypothetical protein